MLKIIRNVQVEQLDEQHFLLSNIDRDTAVLVTRTELNLIHKSINS
jgi:hypothetical protein